MTTARASLFFDVMQVHRIQAELHPENLPFIALMQRLSFV